MKKVNMLILAILILSVQIKAQVCRVYIAGQDADKFLHESQILSMYATYTEADKALLEAFQQLRQKGYISCSADSIYRTDSTLYVNVFVGEKYQWAQLRNINIPMNILTQYRFNPKDYIGKPVSPTQFNLLYDKIITHYENNGYPFASLRLDSIQSINGIMKAGLSLQKGPLTRIDSIIINEDANISRAYVLQYLGLKEGMLYDQKKISSIRKKLQDNPFLQEMSVWRIYFTQIQTTLHLYIKNKSANQADVLIGLMPNNVDNGGKFLLTGDVKLALVNALNQGESLQLNWQNLQYKSPRYDIKFQYPFLLGSSFGCSAKFEFYKKDTTFRTVQGQIGLLYQLHAAAYTKVYYEISNSQLGQINISNLLATRQLPLQADVRYKTIGIEWLQQQLDYVRNPRKGWSIWMNGGLSFRKMLRNTTIDGTYDPVAGKNFSYLYDSLLLQNNKYQINGKLQYFLPLKKRITLAGIYQGGYTLSNQTLYKNEMFQIGGYKLLRGFDEGSLFVNQYQVVSIEPRYLLSLHSYVYALFDGAYLQQIYSQIKRMGWYYSAGVGMSFETKSGMFNINYAVGAPPSQGIQLRNSKIHFGYVNVF